MSSAENYSSVNLEHSDSCSLVHSPAYDSKLPVRNVNKNIIRRTIARCAAIQTLYKTHYCDISTTDAAEEFTRYIISDNDFYKEIDIKFYRKLISSYDDGITSLVDEYCRSSLNIRSYILIKDILSIAAVEMYRVKTKPIVVVNEYIEIAKDFCDDKSVKFVNFVLDRLYKDMHSANILSKAS